MNAELQVQVRHIAIAGNPNCGKTTIFNALTGMRQRVGNYPGVTVERKVGRFHGSHGEPFDLLDLPGTYSLNVRSPDEAVSRDVLLGRREDTARPEMIICVVDASNLERNLYLLSQLLEMRLPVIVALNMVDVAEDMGIVIDLPALRESLGLPVIPMVGTKNVGLVELKQAISAARPVVSEKMAPMPAPVTREAEALGAQLPISEEAAYSEALQLLTMVSKEERTQLSGDPAIEQAALDAQERLRREGIDPSSAIVEARYEWIGEICDAAVTHPGQMERSWSDRIDAILTHRVWGWLSFLAAMALMFFCIFTVASFPMDWIDQGCGALSKWIGGLMPEGDFQSLVTDGVIAGVGGVVIFLPQW